MRPLAIEACFDKDLIDFDETSMAQRLKIYRNWIGTEYPNCDLEQRGLGRKSFEAEETKLKKNRYL